MLILTCLTIRSTRNSHFTWAVFSSVFPFCLVLYPLYYNFCLLGDFVWFWQFQPHYVRSYCTLYLVFFTISRYLSLLIQLKGPTTFYINITKGKFTIRSDLAICAGGLLTKILCPTGNCDVHQTILSGLLLLGSWAVSSLASLSLRRTSSWAMNRFRKGLNHVNASYHLECGWRDFAMLS